jgi:hypothetical protein
MSLRSLALTTVGCLLLPASSAPAYPQDAQICMSAAERVNNGDKLADTEKSLTKPASAHSPTPRTWCRSTIYPEIKRFCDKIP